jgi:phosphocarrier protein HPr
VIEREAKIQNKLGLHARAASKFVGLAQRFGATVTVSTDGEDEEQAIEQIIALIDNRFEEAE